VSVVIGAGIFTITASTAGNITGPSISLSFIVAAITCGLAALCYAEFASTVPVAGSAYTFSCQLRRADRLDHRMGLVLEFAVGAAVVAKGWSTYLGEVFGFAGGTAEMGGFTVDWGALVIIAIVSTLLAIGTKLSSNVSAAITFIKVTVVLLVIVVGAFYIKAANYTPFVPPTDSGGGGSGEQSLFSMLTGAGSSHYGWYGVLAGASIVFFAFIGFDVVATTAEETKKPQRDVPRGILGTLAIVTVLYVAVAVVLTGMVHYSELKKAGEDANLATAFTANGVTWAAKVISIGALAGLTTVVMGADARTGQGAVRHVEGSFVAPPAGQDGFARHTRATHRPRRSAGSRGRVGVPDVQARGDGQRRHSVRIRSRLGWRDRAAPDAPRSSPGLPDTVGAVAPDRRDRRLPVADVEPDRPYLDPLPGLDGGRPGHLLALRPSSFCRGQSGTRCFGVRIFADR
jgi:amino acid permease